MKSTLIPFLTLALVGVRAQKDTPLFEKRFPYTNLPYQADTSDGERGRQFGYNRCNSTTEGQTSLCQTSHINSIDDFCLWGPTKPNSLIGNTEGEAVAWCTKPGRGSRLIPAGALTGVQFMKTSAYVQVVGKINQALINIASDDSGGEMDPHGADARGNPLGGLLYSNAFVSNNGNNGTFQQVIEWHNFMGENEFCLKACDPAGPNAADFCEHVYDRIGCFYNAPADYPALAGNFLSCEGEVQDYPGIYTQNGQVMTYSQPPESLGIIATMPYQPRTPASSNCVTFTSAALFTGLPFPSGSLTATASSATVTVTSAATTSGTRSGSSNSASASNTPTRSSSSSSASATTSSSAAILRASPAQGWSGAVILGGLAVVLSGASILVL